MASYPVPLWRCGWRAHAAARCGTCHGIDGKGAGRAAPPLKSTPADLTKLVKANHGVLSPKAIYEMIDRRKAGQSHRSIEMPIWGCRHDPQM